MNCYFEKVEDKINNLTDKEFYKLVIDSGLEKCPYEEKNKIYHQCECGNTNIDIFSAREVLHHAQGMDIPAVEINYICPDCGSMMTESAYLYKRKEK